MYNPQKGRIVEFSDNVISQRGGETKGDANVVWSLSEEYAIGDECYKDFRVEASEDGDDSGTSMAAPHVSGVAA